MIHRTPVSVAVTAVVVCWGLSSPAAEPKKEAPAGKSATPEVLWKGELHLGDSPEQYKRIVSAGMSMQVPFEAVPSKKYRLAVTVDDVQTLAGEGHYVEVFAHIEPKKGMAGEVVDRKVATFRIKDTSKEEREFRFDLDLSKFGESAYFSVRVRVDNHKFGLWDDFIVKRIMLVEAP